MKRIEKLKLHKLNEKKLKTKQMNIIRGGECSCNCWTACDCIEPPDYGMSNSASNAEVFNNFKNNTRTTLMSG